MAQVRVLSGDYLEDVLYVLDNFSSDEIAGTLLVMAASPAMSRKRASGAGFADSLRVEGMEDRASSTQGPSGV